MKPDDGGAKRAPNRIVIADCEKTGGDYYVDIEIRNRSGGTISRVRGPVGKRFAERVSRLAIAFVMSNRGLKPLA